MNDGERRGRRRVLWFFLSSLLFLMSIAYYSMSLTRFSWFPSIDVFTMFAQIRASLDTYTSPVPIFVIPICPKKNHVDLKLAEKVAMFLSESIELHAPFKIRPQVADVDMFGAESSSLKSTNRDFCIGNLSPSDDEKHFQQISLIDFRHYDQVVTQNHPMLAIYRLFVTGDKKRSKPSLKVSATNSAILYLSEREISNPDFADEAIRSAMHILQSTFFADWNIPHSEKKAKSDILVEDTLGRTDWVLEFEIPTAYEFHMILATPPGAKQAALWNSTDDMLAARLAYSLSTVRLFVDVSVETQIVHDANILLSERDDQSDLVSMHRKALENEGEGLTLHQEDEMRQVQSACNSWLAGDVITLPAQVPPRIARLIAWAGNAKFAPSHDPKDFRNGIILPGWGVISFIGPPAVVEAEQHEARVRVSEKQLDAAATDFVSYLRSIFALPTTSVLSHIPDSFFVSRRPIPRPKLSYLERLVVSGNDFPVPDEYEADLRTSYVRSDISNISSANRLDIFIEGENRKISAPVKNKNLENISSPHFLSVHVTEPTILGFSAWETHAIMRGLFSRWALESSALLRTLQRKIQSEGSNLQLLPRVAYLMRSALDKLNLAIGSVVSATTRAKFTGLKDVDRLHVKEIKQKHDLLFGKEDPPEMRIVLTQVCCHFLFSKFCFRFEVLLRMLLKRFEIQH